MANIKRWNICTRKEYGEGERKKAYWPAVGQLTWFPPKEENKGGFRLELNHLPDVKFYVFEQEAKGEKADAREDAADGEIDPDDIPF